ncbi:MAG: phasin family protein [Alphaproteobacteria bacterium]
MTKTTANVFDVDVTKVLSGMKVPSINIQALAASQRKNLEAIANANKVALEGIQEIARRQGEMVTQSVEDVTGAVTDLMSAGSMEDRAVKNAEFAKSVYQKVLANMWDLGEMVTKSNSRAFGVINKRVADSLDEVKSIVSQKAAAA